MSCDPVDESECPENALCLQPIAQLQIELDSMKTAILSLAKYDSCSQDTECQFIGLGSKPCGGPWEYLIFSTSADTASLIPLVNAYNQKEEELNQRTARGSDCSIAIPPDSVICENGCVAYYEGKAFPDNLCCE